MNVYAVGIDIGSAFSKGVIIDDRKVLWSSIIPSRGDYRLTGNNLRDELLARTGLSPKDIGFVVATGSGAKTVGFADAVRTDISCHAKGIYSLFPSVRTIVDIGDLSSKAFRIDENGSPLRFLLSGKCAGGSARVLKVIAKVLRVKIEDLGALSLKSKRRVDFNTNCAVFAESEAVCRIAEGAAKEDLLAGIHRALAAQLNGLAERIGVKKDYAVVGGGARDEGLVRALEEMAGYPIIVPPEPQLTAALGAAIMAGEAVKL
jgi:predicted CoA-substrate-specific enzyme activase